MSSFVDNFNLNKSSTGITTNRRRSATVSVPLALYPSSETEEKPNSNVHVSVSVSLSESLASISAWASQIVPGSPPSAPSPRRSSFYSSSSKSSAFSPITPRRNSISATFLNLRESPSNQPQTPAPKPVSPADLLAQGYTNVFVHLPSLHRGSDVADSIPSSPSPIRKTENALLPIRRPHRPRTKSLAGEKEEKSTSINRLRSFSFKGKHSKSSQAMPAFNAPPVPSLPMKPSMRPTSPRTKSTKKPKSTPQARYGAFLSPGNGAGALPLAQEVALSQMLDGGSFDVNVRRVTERHARATGAQTKSPSARDEIYKNGRKDRRPIEKREGDGKIGGGINGIYRDAEGGLWWDEDESVELVGLLHSSDQQLQNQHGHMPLTNSNVHSQEKEKRRGLLPRLMISAKPPPTTALPEPPNWVPLHSPVATSGKAFGRKGSSSDTSSADTDGEDPDLDPTYAVRPRDASSVFPAGYTMSAERERHLRRAPRGIDAFGVSPLDTSADSDAYNRARQRRERKRPAPLTLPLPAPTPHALATSSTSTEKITSHPSTVRSPPPPLPALSALTGPTREESEGRQEFFASAFAPAPVTTDIHPSAPVNSPAQEMQAKPKVSRRSSLSIGFPSFALTATGKVGRRASVASASPTSPISRTHGPNPYTNASAATGGAARIAPCSRSSSRPGAASGLERSVKKKASRSRLAGLFKRG